MNSLDSPQYFLQLYLHVPENTKQNAYLIFLKIKCGDFVSDWKETVVKSMLTKCPQNSNGTRDLTTPISAVVSHPWAGSCYLLRSTSIPNLKSLSPPVTYISKDIHNVEYGVVWGN